MTSSPNLLLPVDIAICSRCLDPLNGRFLKCRNQTLTIELGDEIVEASLASALDRRRCGNRGKRDNRHWRGSRVAADRLGELKAVHAEHLDVGDDHIEALAALQSRERLI